MKNITDLREHLFDTLEKLKSATKEWEIELEAKRAISIAKIAEVMIKSADAENKFIHITKGTGSGFIGGKNSDNKPNKLIPGKVNNHYSEIKTDDHLKKN